MRLVILRHGQTFANVINTSGKILYTGGLDTEYTELTKEGIKKAEAVKNYLDVKDIDILYASDLKRAIKTANIIRPDLDVIKDKRIRERSLGDFEGHSKELLENNKELNKYLTDENFNKFRADFVQKAPNGENYTEVYNRSKDFLEEIIDKYGNTDKTIGMVSHYNTIKCMLVYLLKLEPKELCLKLYIDNSTPIVFDYDNENKSFILKSHTIDEILNNQIKK